MGDGAEELSGYEPESDGNNTSTVTVSCYTKLKINKALSSGLEKGTFSLFYLKYFVIFTSLI